MVQDCTISELRGDRVVLRTTAAGDVQALREMHAAPAVAAWWGLPCEQFPLTDEPESTRLTIWADGEIAGLIQFGEEPEPNYRHATVDLFIAPEKHNQGLGTDAVATLVRQLFDDRGHHRITIDPAADNAAAIRCYEKVGFCRVGPMRRAWRDPSGTWRDVVLMELVTPPA